MRLGAGTLILALAGVSMVSYCLAATAAKKELSPTEIDHLIEQLGDDQYVMRQRAEVELLELGVDAYPYLQAAETHADLEIATRAKYLLNQISIEWVRQTDPPVVRSIMARYGDVPKSQRLAKVGQLAKLKKEQGFGALCRIARFEKVGQIARYAALSILENGFLPQDRAQAAIELLDGEIGTSTEVPISWVSVYVDQLGSPKTIDERWLELIDAEISLLSSKAVETTDAITGTLVNSHLELCDSLSDANAIFSGLQRRIEVQTMRTEGLAAPLTSALSWIIDREQWGALQLLEQEYSAQLEQDRLLLYFLAITRDKQGLEEEAMELAEQATFIEVAEPAIHNQIALLVGDLGRHDWAEREWRQVIDSLPVTDFQSLVARNSLATYRLNDQGDHEAASKLLAESIDAIRDDPALRKQYQRDRRKGQFLRSASGNRQYFLACQYEAQEDFEKQRRHLDQAFRFSPDNADVLIAMYHLEEATGAYRQATMEKISKVQMAMEKVIHQDPDDAQGYNQWAWLISNTEGDFDKAVERSKRSLELDPGNASYLDTLGRCYYAAGDLDNAIKVQREAIESHPHLQVMQRQLKLFEDALQKRETGEN